MFRSPKDVRITKTKPVEMETETEFNCDFCENGPWPTEADFEIHRKKAHKWEIIKLMNNESIFMCPICVRQQTDRSSLIEHIKVMHMCCTPNANRINRKIFICDYCNKLFFNRELLIVHMQYWHSLPCNGEVSDRINCPKCWKLIRRTNMWYHFVMHGIFSNTLCPICLENFDNTTVMIEHVNKHQGYFVCDLCGYVSSRECYYTNHMERHKKNVPIDVTGDVSRYFLPCGNVFTTWKDRFHSFFKGIPLTSLVRICILCRHLCETEEEMKQHICRDHGPEQEAKSKRHLCMCGEEFFNSVLLKQHVLKNEGNHGVWDETSQLPASEFTEEEGVYQIYELTDSINIEVNEIIVRGFENNSETEQEDWSIP